LRHPMRQAGDAEITDNYRVLELTKSAVSGYR
jgi:hypothetical protein